jgi:hypothetical protein
MRKIAALAVLLTTAFGTAAPALADSTPICLKTNWIDKTTVVGPQEILFRMKDGKTYSSRLRTPCIGLRNFGFAYVTSYMELCGKSESIRVLETGQVCTLGNFTPVTIGQHAHSNS